jgi:hypothetical protein
MLIVLGWVGVASCFHVSRGLASDSSTTRSTKTQLKPSLLPKQSCCFQRICEIVLQVVLVESRRGKEGGSIAVVFDHPP